MVFVDSFVRSFVDTISLSLDGFDLPPFFFIFPSLPPPTMECLNFFLKIQAIQARIRFFS